MTLEPRERVDYEDVDPDTTVVAVVRNVHSGQLTVVVHVFGHITIDGELYEYDQYVRTRLSRGGDE